MFVVRARVCCVCVYVCPFAVCVCVSLSVSLSVSLWVRLSVPVYMYGCAPASVNFLVCGWVGIAWVGLMHAKF